MHDGAQQRLIALLLRLRGAQRGAVAPDAAVDGAVVELAAAVKELRELAQGIHPSALSERGLAAALRIVAARAPVPVELDVTTTPLDTNISVAAYYIVSEALNNVAKYAAANRAAVRVRETERALIVVVEDDGKGGARPGGRHWAQRPGRPRRVVRGTARDREPGRRRHAPSRRAALRVLVRRDWAGRRRMPP